MPPVSALENAVYNLALIAQAFLIVKLTSIGLSRSYPWFFRFLCFHFVASVALLMVDPRKNLYGYIWIPVQMLLFTAYYLVVYELYSLVLNDFPGIQKWGRRVMLFGGIACLAVAAVTLAADLSNGDARYPILQAVNLFRRGVTSSLVLFIAVMTAFLAYFPVPLKSNVLAHAMLFGAYFLTETIGTFCRNLAGPSAARLVSTVLGCLTLTVVLGWIFLLSEAGERKKRTFRWNLTGGEESRVLGHLQSINDSLMASSRK
jgi:hypothetical protein